MFAKRRRRGAELPGQSSGTKVADRTDLENYATIGQQVHQGTIVNRSDTVADALDTEHLHGVADDLRSANFTGVDHSVQTTIGSVLIDSREVAGREAQFVAPDAKSDDARGLALLGPVN